MPVMSGEVTRRAALRGDGLLRMSIGMTENRRVTRTGVVKTLVATTYLGNRSARVPKKVVTSCDKLGEMHEYLGSGDG